MFEVFSLTFLRYLFWWHVTTLVVLSSIVVAVVIIMQNMKFMDLFQCPLQENSYARVNSSHDN
jgi:hypothetical protein